MPQKKNHFFGRIRLTPSDPSTYKPPIDGVAADFAADADASSNEPLLVLPVATPGEDVSAWIEVDTFGCEA